MKKLTKIQELEKDIQTLNGHRKADNVELFPTDLIQFTKQILPCLYVELDPGSGCGYYYTKTGLCHTKLNRKNSCIEVGVDGILLQIPHKIGSQTATGGR